MHTHQGSQDPVVLHAIIEAQAAEIRRLETKVYDAYKDELTGLPTRTELKDAATKALSRGNIPTSIIFLDLNGFSEVNNTIGHDAGDSILIQFARLLKDQRLELGENAALVTVARLSGDEFAILLTHTGKEGAQNFVDNCKEVLASRVFTVNEAQVSLRSAMGIATTGPGLSTISELLHHADKAMYIDKELMTRNGEHTKIVK